MYSLATVLCMCLLAMFPELGQARIGMRGASEGPRLSSEVIDENQPLSALAFALGQSSRARISRLETQLRPMYIALPKSSNGTLNPGVVRYALHRFFVQSHGWHIKGLGIEGGSRNTSSLTDILKDRVPSHVLALVEEHLFGRGFGLHELAVLVATFDDFIHGESIERLRKVYAAHEVPVESSTTPEMTHLIIQTYMMFYLLPSERLMQLNSHQLQRILPEMPRVYPGWEGTMLWVEDLQMDLAFNNRMERNPFRTEAQGQDFAATARLVEEIGTHFGRFQDLECRGLKFALLDMEEGESGRVLLSSFYGNAHGGAWHFKESATFLRDTGALDESDVQQPRVVIPNYVNGASNCIAASRFYSVCCIDECEALTVQLENKIASPSGAPQDITNFVATTSSHTIASPRNLSETLIGRLNDISAQHGGKVPLHGRLFAQWMHHAYPRECPYPQAPGASNVGQPQTLDEWMEASRAGNNSFVASKEDMERHANVPAQGGSSIDEIPAAPFELPWSHDEELVMILESSEAERGWVSHMFRKFAWLSVFASVVVSLRHASNSRLSELPLPGGGSLAAKTRHSQFV